MPDKLASIPADALQPLRPLLAFLLCEILHVSDEVNGPVVKFICATFESSRVGERFQCYRRVRNHMVQRFECTSSRGTAKKPDFEYRYG